MKNPRSVQAGKKAADTKRRKAAARHRDYVNRFKKVKENAMEAVTMAKVRIRQAVAKAPWPRWHLLTFAGERGGESRGVVDMIAIRKDFGEHAGMKRGDSFQIILIQIKGGSAARPASQDRDRLREVAKRHNACGILLATWKKGESANLYSLPDQTVGGTEKWGPMDDLTRIFGRRATAKRLGH